MARKKEVARAQSHQYGGVKSQQPHNTLTKQEKGKTFYHHGDKLKRLKMYDSGRPTRDRDGSIIKPGAFLSKEIPKARIQSDRRWFGNTRVIGQKELEQFREEIGKKVNDPYQMLLNQSKLPMSLLVDSTKVTKMNLLDTETFHNTFGPKAQRKRPKLQIATLEDMAETAGKSLEEYKVEKDSDLTSDMDLMDPRNEVSDPIFSKGQSKRIWGELYKVVDSSDVVVEVVDARDPMGTRCFHIEKHIKSEAAHKHVILLLNKCDLVPTWVTARWVKELSKEYPTLAFHASITNPFGKGSLIQLLRQFGKLHADKKQISVGFIGYPNVGKSSIINTLKKKKVCKVAPIPGETKVWQYVTLMRRIYLIDCPGVVYNTGDSETDIILKGVVRVENVKNPDDHITEVLKRVKPLYIEKTYGVHGWEDHLDFLSKLATKFGKLLKGGEPDVTTVAKMVLNDWIRGKTPFFTEPPKLSPEEEQARLKAVNSRLLRDTDQKISENSDATELNGDSNEIIDHNNLPELKVQQLFSKIRVVAEFNDEDLKGNGEIDDLIFHDFNLQQNGSLQDDEDEDDENEEDDGEENEDEDQEHEFEENGDINNNDENEQEEEAEAEETQVENNDEDDNAKQEEEEEELQFETLLKSAKPALPRKRRLPVFEITDLDPTPQPKKQKIIVEKPARRVVEEAKEDNYEDEDEDEDEDEPKGTKKKEPRMTTNKRKTGAHYYETANVKNKNKKRRKIE